jgi:hypothetical protein
MCYNRRVNATLKALIVWLMLLAVPVQGFAAATMLWCAPSPAVTAHEAAGGHNHGLMVLASQASDGNHDHAITADATAHHAGHAHHHADTKCNACAACYLGASMPPTFASLVPVQTTQFESIPFISRPIASADLALPERPPRA